MQCTICKRPLSDPKDPFSEDCGGDCLACMAFVGDPPCVFSILSLLKRGNQDTVRPKTNYVNLQREYDQLKKYQAQVGLEEYTEFADSFEEAIGNFCDYYNINKENISQITQTTQ